MKITKDYFKAKTLLVIGCLSFACQAIAMGKTPEQWELHLEKTIPYEKKAFCFIDEAGNEFLISVVNNQVEFRENNKVLNTFNGQFLIRKTPDGHFYLLQKILSEKRVNSGELVFEDELTVCDYRGEIIWAAKGVGANDYNLSPKGEYVVYFVSPEFHPANPPTFINKNGIINSNVVSVKTNNVEKWEIDYSKISSWAFTRRGSMLFVGLSGGSNPGVIAVFDSNGTPVKYFNTSANTISKIIISSDEKEIFIKGFDAKFKPVTELFNFSTTNLVWKNNAAVQDFIVEWEKDGNFLTFKFDASVFRLINLTSGTIQWEKKINPCSDFSVMKSVLFQDRIVAYGNCGSTGQDALIFLDKNGDLILNHELPSKVLEFGGLDIVDIFDDRLVINTANKISIFKIQKK